MKWPQLLLGGLLCGAVQFMIGALFHLLLPILAPTWQDEYAQECLFRPWSGWTQAYMLLHPWLFGLLFAFGFFGLSTTMDRATLCCGSGGVIYGSAIVLLGSIPIFALNLASFQISAKLVGAWAAQNSCQNLAAGYALGLYSATFRR